MYVTETVVVILERNIFSIAVESVFGLLEP